MDVSSSTTSNFGMSEPTLWNWKLTTHKAYPVDSATEEIL